MTAGTNHNHKSLAHFNPRRIPIPNHSMISRPAMASNESGVRMRFVLLDSKNSKISTDATTGKTTEGQTIKIHEAMVTLNGRLTGLGNCSFASAFRSAMDSGVEGFIAWRRFESAGVNTRIPLRVALVNVLEEGGTLLRVERTVVGGGQRVEHVLDGQLELGARRRLLPPVEHEQLL